MASTAYRAIAPNTATSGAPVLVLHGGAAPKARGPLPTLPSSDPAPAGPRSRHHARSRKPSFATNAIGLDNLAALNIFMHAAEACSYTEAGRQLGLSSSAVGKCITRLEQRLSVRLFHRNTRSINLTHEGNAFLDSCRRIFSELRSLEDELAQTKGAPKGRLRVSMPLSGMLMVPALGDFIRAYPDVDLDLDFTDSAVDVVDGGYDVVLRSGEVTDSRLKTRQVGTYQFVIVGSPNYFARAEAPLKPQDLLSHACLHRKHPATGKLHAWPFRAAATDGPLVPPTSAVASTLDALVHLAETGVGIACVPDFCAARQIAGGSLVSVLKDHLEGAEVVRAMWPSSRHRSPKLRTFIDFLADNVLPGSTLT